MKTEQITAWITKYALTSGISVVKGQVCHDISPSMLSYGIMNSVHGKDWHRTQEAALSRAEEMKLAKIASLKKKIEKLERMRFKVMAAEAVK